jgi:hypothetical protein
MYAHVVYANTSNCDIWASGPHVRIDKISSEASDLPVSSAENIIWSKGSIDDWTAMRQTEIADAAAAVHSIVKRSVKSLRAVALIDSLNGPKAPRPNFKVVADIKRDEEVRGQSWAIVAIVGDPVYEIKKRKILDELGSRFFDMIRDLAPGQTDQHDEDSLQYIFENLSNKDQLTQTFNDTYTSLAAAELQDLIQEPQIAIFGFGDDPDALKEKARAFSAVPGLMHASIAVVRMYSWLNLNYVDSHKIEHTSRLPMADSFFKAMRQAKIQ